jgi:hypothetical protein
VKTGTSHETSAVEQAVTRALRENLERLQRTSEELHHAVNDVVSACASNKPTHALPPMLRAQTAAASLSASLEVLSRFVAMALQPGPRSPLETQITSLVGQAIAESSAASARPEPSHPAPTVSRIPLEPRVEEHVAAEIELHPESEPLERTKSLAAAVGSELESTDEFDVHRLSPEEQELHRRANRVAKVSMQDIKMLRPEQVRLGREKKDLCIRLKDDIEKAHREYDRRFKPIMDHPVDYFYRWLVEILAEGDPHALGEYPYAAPVRHH